MKIALTPNTIGTNPVFVEVLRSTDKALLLEVTEIKIWIPKSVLVEVEHSFVAENDERPVNPRYIKTWFMDKNEILYTIFE